MLLLKRVELHLHQTRTPPARFGRDALGDPNFVFDLKDGREPRSKTRKKVMAYIADREAAIGGHE
jgi:hypothetical protein